jgi:hypothetical protein
MDTDTQDREYLEDDDHNVGDVEDHFYQRMSPQTREIL